MRSGIRVRKSTVVKIAVAIVIICVAGLVGAFARINANYLYHPFNTPKGNLSYLKWYESKKPMDVEVMSWSEEGERLIYETSKENTEEARYILEGFDKLQHLEGYDSKKYLRNTPSRRGKEYSIIVKSVSKRNDDGTTDGMILLNVSFFENGDMMERGRVNFYKLTDEYKKHIIETYSKVVKKE